MSVTRILLKDYVEEGEVTVGDFVVDKTTAELAPKDGEVLCDLIYLSVDPYMRGRMRNTKGYFVGSFVPGQPIESGGIAQVKASRAEGFDAGDYVSGMFPWEDKFVISASKLMKLPANLKVPLSYYLGTLGMPGFTAHGSLKSIANPQKGEVVFISAAAGAVGCVAGQLCKLWGCRVLGSAGSDVKVDFLVKELGFDAAWNYKSRDTAGALAEYAPDGIDVYFDNVGGPTLETAMDATRNHARIVACGAISQYNKRPGEMYGVKNLVQVVTKRLRLQGFICGDFTKEMRQEFLSEVGAAVAEGKLRVVEQVVAGLENAGQAFCDMMKGENLGKMVVQVGFDPFRK